LPEGSERFELFPWAMGRENVYCVRKFSAGKLIGLGPFDGCPLFLSDASHISRSRHCCMPDAFTVQAFPDRVIHLGFCEAGGIIFRKGNKSNELARITRNSCMRPSPPNSPILPNWHTDRLKNVFSITFWINIVLVSETPFAQCSQMATRSSLCRALFGFKKSADAPPADKP